LNIEKQNKDFELEWVFAQYEEGVSVAAIAKELGKSESYIYAHMKRRPQEYEDVKNIREQIYNRIIRRVRGVADKITLEYVESLSKIITDPDADEKQKAKAFDEMDKVLRIAKQYSDRVLLAEGKATENIGMGGMPITMIVRKTYPGKDEAENACDD
jgi:predicted transcriptional regulator